MSSSGGHRVGAGAPVASNRPPPPPPPEAVTEDPGDRFLDFLSDEDLSSDDDHDHDHDHDDHKDHPFESYDGYDDEEEEPMEESTLATPPGDVSGDDEDDGEDEPDQGDLAAPPASATGHPRPIRQGGVFMHEILVEVGDGTRHVLLRPAPVPPPEPQPRGPTAGSGDRPGATPQRPPSSPAPQPSPPTPVSPATPAAAGAVVVVATPAEGFPRPDAQAPGRQAGPGHAGALDRRMSQIFASILKPFDRAAVQPATLVTAPIDGLPLRPAPASTGLAVLVILFALGVIVLLRQVPLRPVGDGATGAPTASLLDRIRRALAPAKPLADVTVAECWFCSATAEGADPDSFTCQACGSYNGFTSTGDYDVPMMTREGAHFDTSRLTFARRAGPRAEGDTEQPARTATGPGSGVALAGLPRPPALCDACQRNQELLVGALAQMLPEEDAPVDRRPESPGRAASWLGRLLGRPVHGPSGGHSGLLDDGTIPAGQQVELDRRRAALEQRYALCKVCEWATQNFLRQQDRRLKISATANRPGPVLLAPARGGAGTGGPGDFPSSQSGPGSNPFVKEFESYAALLHHGRRVNFVRSLLYFSQSILSLVQLGCDSASALVAVASPSGGPVFCASLRPVDRVAPHAILAALASLVQVGLALHEQILVRRHARSFSIPGPPSLSTTLLVNLVWLLHVALFSGLLSVTQLPPASAPMVGLAAMQVILMLMLSCRPAMPYIPAMNPRTASQLDALGLDILLPATGPEPGPSSSASRPSRPEAMPFDESEDPFSLADRLTPLSFSGAATPVSTVASAGPRPVINPALGLSVDTAALAAAAAAAADSPAASSGSATPSAPPSPPAGAGSSHADTPGADATTGDAGLAAPSPCPSSRPNPFLPRVSVPERSFDLRSRQPLRPMEQLLFSEPPAAELRHRDGTVIAVPPSRLPSAASISRELGGLPTDVGRAFSSFSIRDAGPAGSAAGAAEGPAHWGSPPASSPSANMAVPPGEATLAGAFSNLIGSLASVGKALKHTLLPSTTARNDAPRQHASHYGHPSGPVDGAMLPSGGADHGGALVPRAPGYPPTPGGRYPYAYHHPSHHQPPPPQQQQQQHHYQYSGQFSPRAAPAGQPLSPAAGPRLSLGASPHLGGGDSLAALPPSRSLWASQPHGSADSPSGASTPGRQGAMHFSAFHSMRH
ncbi:hypothetical protein H696_05745 [Fonticula alba]|uniref:Ima1 N-terminal domain-containing protein n=1 Tax=Fonticula alba TaxID=691883 RepID=A0A058Z1I8_FONAL|nr:hypothetical protein H696_05745 [Fonticula alba]KCV67803.1 hypothetical protein H696_05745 [Fonticula alba]|eukprot:XP_009497834.1 hypothetical protein H696_05745 [Fonticula alba]